jgi:hypothetical protein
MFKVTPGRFTIDPTSIHGAFTRACQDQLDKTIEIIVSKNISKNRS